MKPRSDLLWLGSLPKDLTSELTTPQLFNLRSRASLIGFVFSGANCLLPFEKTGFQNYKSLQNCLGHSEESEDKNSTTPSSFTHTAWSRVRRVWRECFTQDDLAGLQLWKSSAKLTSSPQVNHLRIWKLVSVFLPLNKETQSYLSEPSSSNSALKMLSKANFQTIYQLFKITQLSCHSTTLKELWKSRNHTGLTVRKCALVFLSPACLTLNKSLPLFTQGFSHLYGREQHFPLLPQKSMRTDLVWGGGFIPDKSETVLLLTPMGWKKGALPEGGTQRRYRIARGF